MHADNAIPAALEELLRPLRNDPGASAVFSDIDGTLAAIAQRPGDAFVPERAKEALAAIAGRYAVAGCVTGRRAGEAREMVGVDDLVYIGIHGFERLLPGADEPVPNPRLGGHAGDAREFVGGAAAERIANAGLRVEDKGAIQALHWRAAVDEERARRCALEIGEEATSNDLVGHLGRKVLEIRPPIPINKGTAVSVLLGERPVRRCLYAGDDHTDVHVFVRLCAMTEDGQLDGAVCIGVAADESPPEISELADHVVHSPQEFVPVLEFLAG